MARAKVPGEQRCCLRDHGVLLGSASQPKDYALPSRHPFQGERRRGDVSDGFLESSLAVLLKVDCDATYCHNHVVRAVVLLSDCRRNWANVGHVARMTSFAALVEGCTSSRRRQWRLNDVWWHLAGIDDLACARPLLWSYYVASGDSTSESSSQSAVPWLTKPGFLHHARGRPETSGTSFGRLNQKSLSSRPVCKPQM